jgi:hypothetical protein
MTLSCSTLVPRRLQATTFSTFGRIFRDFEPTNF